VVGPPPAARAPLPRMPYGHGEMAWWGIVFLLAIETTVFASLIFSYFYLRAGVAQWPPAGIEPPDLMLPTINTVVLLASAVPVAWADRGIRRGNQVAVRAGKLAGQALLVLFLALKAVEYAGYDYTWRTNAYGSIVWTLTGFHVAHVTVAVVKSLVVLTLAWKGYFSERRYLGVQANAFYWYFVVLIWVPIYVTLYLSPRLLSP
jgi:heme/copper-type cytochrome/quinol oxidase subunit 3